MRVLEKPLSAETRRNLIHVFEKTKEKTQGAAEGGVSRYGSLARKGWALKKESNWALTKNSGRKKTIGRGVEMKDSKKGTAKEGPRLRDHSRGAEGPRPKRDRRGGGQRD